MPDRYLWERSPDVVAVHAEFGEVCQRSHLLGQRPAKAAVLEVERGERGESVKLVRDRRVVEVTARAPHVRRGAATVEADDR